MKYKIIFSIVICFLFAFNSVKADSLETRRDSLIQFVPNIKIIGHSWAVGTFKGKEEYFKKYGITIDETSEIGTSLSWAYEKLKDVPEGKYDAICLLSGINDYKSDIGYITKMLSNIMELGLSKTPVLFVFNIGYYEPATEMVTIINKWLDETEKLNPGLIVVIDIYNEIEARKKEGFKMSRNGLHPSSYDVLQNLFIYVVKNHYGLQ